MEDSYCHYVQCGCALFLTSRNIEARSKKVQTHLSNQNRVSCTPLRKHIIILAVGDSVLFDLRPRLPRIPDRDLRNLRKTFVARRTSRGGRPWWSVDDLGLHFNTLYTPLDILHLSEVQTLHWNTLYTPLVWNDVQTLHWTARTDCRSVDPSDHPN